MHEEGNLSEIQKEWHGTLGGYIGGFVACLLLTCISFFLVAIKWFPGWGLAFVIIGLAIVQASAQLLFFLHIGQEAKPRWETLIFSFMTMVLLIVVLGTLWIIYDLNHRVMPKTSEAYSIFGET